MIARPSGCSIGVSSTVLLAGLLLGLQPAAAQVKARTDVSQIPQNVMGALRARFPRAEIDQWTREKEDGVVIYDFEFRQDDQKYEADIEEDGTLHNWEKAIGFEDLPEAVKQAFREKYPESTPKETMQIVAVADGKEALEGYEIVLLTADKKEVEVTLAPDGRILEEPGEEK